MYKGKFKLKSFYINRKARTLALDSLVVSKSNANKDYVYINIKASQFIQIFEDCTLFDALQKSYFSIY